VVGAALAKQQGAQALRRIQTTLRAGQTPAIALVDGFLIFCAGLLLVTPGLLTDTVGFTLLIPPARAGIRAWLSREFKKRVTTVTPLQTAQNPDRRGSDQQSSGGVIDVSATVLPNDDRQ